MSFKIKITLFLTLYMTFSSCSSFFSFKTIEQSAQEKLEEAAQEPFVKQVQQLATRETTDWYHDIDSIYTRKMNFNPALPQDLACIINQLIPYINAYQSYTKLINSSPKTITSWFKDTLTIPECKTGKNQPILDAVKYTYTQKENTKPIIKSCRSWLETASNKLSNLLLEIHEKLLVTDMQYNWCYTETHYLNAMTFQQKIINPLQALAKTDPVVLTSSTLATTLNNLTTNIDEISDTWALAQVLKAEEFADLTETTNKLLVSLYAQPQSVSSITTLLKLISNFLKQDQLLHKKYTNLSFDNLFTSKAATNHFINKQSIKDCYYSILLIKQKINELVSKNNFEQRPLWTLLRNSVAEQENYNNLIEQEIKPYLTKTENTKLFLFDLRLLQPLLKQPEIEKTIAELIDKNLYAGCNPDQPHDMSNIITNLTTCANAYQEYVRLTQSTPTWQLQQATQKLQTILQDINTKLSNQNFDYLHYLNQFNFQQNIITPLQTNSNAKELAINIKNIAFDKNQSIYGMTLAKFVQDPYFKQLTLLSLQAQEALTQEKNPIKAITTLSLFLQSYILFDNTLQKHTMDTLPNNIFDTKPADIYYDSTNTTLKQWRKNISDTYVKITNLLDKKSFIQTPLFKTIEKNFTLQKDYNLIINSNIKPYLSNTELFLFNQNIVNLSSSDPLVIKNLQELITNTVEHWYNGLNPTDPQDMRIIIDQLKPVINAYQQITKNITDTASNWHIREASIQLTTLLTDMHIKLAVPNFDYNYYFNQVMFQEKIIELLLDNKLLTIKNLSFDKEQASSGMFLTQLIKKDYFKALTTAHEYVQQALDREQDPIKILQTIDQFLQSYTTFINRSHNDFPKAHFPYIFTYPVANNRYGQLNHTIKQWYETITAMHIAINNTLAKENFTSTRLYTLLKDTPSAQYIYNWFIAKNTPLWEKTYNWILNTLNQPTTSDNFVFDQKIIEETLYKQLEANTLNTARALDTLKEAINSLTTLSDLGAMASIPCNINDQFQKCYASLSVLIPLITPYCQPNTTTLIPFANETYNKTLQTLYTDLKCQIKILATFLKHTNFDKPAIAHYCHNNQEEIKQYYQLEQAINNIIQPFQIPIDIQPLVNKKLTSGINLTKKLQDFFEKIKHTIITNDMIQEYQKEFLELFKEITETLELLKSEQLRKAIEKNNKDFKEIIETSFGSRPLAPLATLLSPEHDSCINQIRTALFKPTKDIAYDYELQTRYNTYAMLCNKINIPTEEFKNIEDETVLRCLYSLKNIQTKLFDLQNPLNQEITINQITRPQHLPDRKTLANYLLENLTAFTDILTGCNNLLIYICHLPQKFQHKLTPIKKDIIEITITIMPMISATTIHNQTFELEAIEKNIKTSWPVNTDESFEQFKHAWNNHITELQTAIRNTNTLTRQNHQISLLFKFDQESDSVISPQIKNFIRNYVFNKRIIIPIAVTAITGFMLYYFLSSKVKWAYQTGTQLYTTLKNFNLNHVKQTVGYLEKLPL